MEKDESSALAEYEALKRAQGVATLGLDGVFRKANALMCEWLGYAENDLLGRHHGECFDVRQLEVEELWKKLRNGQAQSGEFRHRRKNGSEIWLRVSFCPVTEKDGRVSGVVMVAVEVLKQRTATQFLANMSHEIRTPMNGIFGMLSLLQDVSVGEKAKGYVDVCLHAAESLLAVLDDVLLFAKAEENVIELEHAPFNLNSLVEDSLFIASGNLTHEHEIDVTCFIDPRVPLSLIGDPSRLRQVLQNLLTNAVKFTRKGEVALRVTKESGTPLKLRFEVTDTGIGISEEDQARLFTPFIQADASITRKYGGSGLGLAVCKRLVALFQGEIGVRSTTGKGSTFWFTAVFTEHDVSNSRQLGVTEQQRETLKELRVLVVDDNETNCLALESTLNLFGTKVVTAQSGAEGLKLLRDEIDKTGKAFDFILLDFHMPKMNGLDVAREVTKMCKEATAPKIIVFSSGLDYRMLKDEPGIVAYTSKPLRRGQLLHMICGIASGAPTVRNSGSGSHLNLNQVMVLLVEDNATNRRVAGEMLKRAHFKVVEAHNGAEAIEKISDETQIVLMDVHMPVLDGITATQLLKQTHPKVKVVMLTADQTEDTRKKCMAAGASKFLLKPLKNDILLQALSSILTNAGENTQVRCLIVDDVQTNRVLAGHVMNKMFGNPHLVFAASGEEAVEAVKRSSAGFDWCLMDIKMPGIDGIEATRQILAVPRGRQPVKVVGVTGLDDVETIRQCYEAGMVSVQVKPLRAQNLEFMMPGKALPMLPTSTASDLGPALYDEEFLEDLDEETKRAVIEGWKESSAGLLEELKEAMAKKEWTEVREVAHSLKGSAAQVGASWASAIALQIEQDANNPKVERKDVATLIDSFEHVMKSTFELMDK